MSLDLYQEYKKISQRASRDGSCIIKGEMKGVAKELILERSSPKEKLRLAHILLSLESMLSGIKVLHSERIIDALQSDNYEINIPPAMVQRYTEKAPKWGFVYIATSKSKPGQCKLGSTTIGIKKRFQSYAHRYEDKLDLYAKFSILNPLKHENEIKPVVKERLVSGLTNGDSNEWYSMSPEELEEIIEEITDTYSETDEENWLD